MACIISISLVFLARKYKVDLWVCYLQFFSVDMAHANETAKALIKQMMQCFHEWDSIWLKVCTRITRGRRWPKTIPRRVIQQKRIQPQLPIVWARTRCNLQKCNLLNLRLVMATVIMVIHVFLLVFVLSLIDLLEVSCWVSMKSKSEGLGNTQT